MFDDGARRPPERRPEDRAPQSSQPADGAAAADGGAPDRVAPAAAADEQGSAAAQLRAEAEERLAAQRAAEVPRPGLPPDAELLHELRVHQIELEMQNEELRRTHVELEESRARYYRLFDEAPVGYVTLDAAAMVTQANLTATVLLGRGRADLTGHPFVTLVAKDDRSRFYRLLRRLQTDPAPCSCELRLTRQGHVSAGGAADTRELWARIDALPDYPAAGDPTVRLAFSDVTDKRAAEHDLAESEQRYRTLFEQSPIGIALHDAGGRLISANPTCLRLFGVDDVDELRSLEGIACRALSGGDKQLVPRSEPLRLETALDFDAHGPLGAAHTRRRGVAWFEILISSVGAPAVAYLTQVQEITARKEAERESATLRAMRDAAEQAALVGSWRADAGTGRLTWSPEVYRLFDVDAAGFDGDVAAVAETRVYPDDRAAFFAALKWDPEAPSSYGSEYRVVHRDGSVHVLHADGGPERDPTAEPGLVGFVQDVTAMREAERALRASEAHFRAFFEKANVGMATSDPEKGWIEVNDALCAMLGCSRQELAGFTWAELTHPDDLAKDLAEFERVLAGEIDGYDLDKRFVRRNGHVVDTHLVVQAVRKESGDVDYVAAVLEDVSERVAAEAALRRLNDHLEELVRQRTAQLEMSNRELESFVYSAAHDLRAPLRAIDGFSEILVQDAGDKLGDDEIQHLGRVRRAAQRMALLIDQLMTLSRLTRTDLRIAEVDVTALSAEAIDDLRESEPERDVETSVAPDLKARADAELLRLVLVNLLGNAWKFTGERDTAHIEVGAFPLDEELVFFVRDDGAGFDAAASQHLFGAFQRFHSAERFPGNGVGLATVQRIVNRHGGRVWAESAIDEGATFYFTLPEDVAPPC